MKMSLALGPRRVLDRETAWGCFTANLAFPGVGSLVAGRRAGYVQMVVAMVGMIVSGVFTVRCFTWYFSNKPRLLALASSDLTAYFREIWINIRWPLLGISLFAFAWIWGMISGLVIVNQSKRTQS